MYSSDNYIRQEDIRPGYTYYLHGRNFSYGVARVDKLGVEFIGIRQKFARLFLFTEIHWDSDSNFGSVKPYIELEKCPFEVISESNDELFDYLQGVEKSYANRI